MTDEALTIARQIIMHVLSGDMGEDELKRVLPLVQAASWSDEAFKVVDIAACRVADIFHQDRLEEHLKMLKDAGTPVPPLLSMEPPT